MGCEAHRLREIAMQILTNVGVDHPRVHCDNARRFILVLDVGG